MKYCEDDIEKARNILNNIRYSTEELREFYLLVNLSDEDAGTVSMAIDTLINIIEYGETLRDQKINKLVKMKKIIRGE